MTIPTPVVIAVVVWIVASKVLDYLRKTDCDERVWAARQQGSREAMSIYRDAYLSGVIDAEHDKKHPPKTGKKTDA